MTTDGQRRLDRAVLVLGVLSLVTAASTVARGDLDIFRIRGWGVVVAAGLGVLAVLAGWLGQRALTRVAAAGFLAAAVIQLAQLGGELGDVEHGVLGGNASTVALWLALALGLAVLGMAAPPEAAPADPADSASQAGPAGSADASTSAHPSPEHPTPTNGEGK